MNSQPILKTFLSLFQEDIYTLKETFFDKFINTAIWSVSTVAVSAYLLPAFGMRADYGAFIAIGTIVSSSGFETFAQIANFISDLEGEKHISFHLMLPMPSWLIFLKKMCVYSFNSLIISIFTLFSCKIILWNQLNIWNFHPIKFSIAMILMNIFFGAFTLWCASFTKSMLAFENMVSRIIFPLWFLGGFQFSWQSMYEMSPALAYISLLNPYIYAMEILRGASLNQSEYLSFWICAPALIFFTFALGAWAIIRLKKRLDFV